MSTTETTPPAAPAPTPAPPASDDAGRAASLAEALASERVKSKGLSDRLTALEAEREASKLAEMGEVERVKTQLAAAEAERDTLRAQGVLQERSDHIRRAARNFRDPEEAVALARGLGVLEQVDSAEAAERLVKGWEKDRPHLLRAADPPNVTAPGVERVLQDGLTPAPPSSKDDGRTLTHAELKALSADAMADLEANSPEVYARSIAALGKP